ncbi:MAG: aminotransferase class I/II-fold pyridoxal phosphate-dependent enzyme [Alphaproteobacteria bacterium]|nr:aminotransferase class I/II-fold pyridoxal phosphate-dependent enzyme [Alphaproteobacteria bacterium]
MKNNMPRMSKYFDSIQPSAIRLSGLEFSKREDRNEINVLDVSVGNVSLPMPKILQKRMFNLCNETSPFANGVNSYTCTRGTEEANNAFLNILKHEGFDISNLYTQITDGGSKAMELAILGICGEAGKKNKPLMVMDAAYTNYMSIARRLGRKTVSITRHLNEDGLFAIPCIKEIEKAIKKHKPNSLLVIPCDNPTGQKFTKQQMIDLAKLCVKYNIWMLSDEAYRELIYTKDKEVISIWGITDKEVPGIEGRRISIETSSKMWNACGLRIGALITDNKEFIEKSVSENTANLCANSIGQYIFGALAEAKKSELNRWYEKQRKHYYKIATAVEEGFKKELPDIIVSKAEASLYSVIDVRNIVDEKFNCVDFIKFCAANGKVKIKGNYRTLFLSPMLGFYSVKKLSKNPGRTQMRISYVRELKEMKQIPVLFKSLLEDFLRQ